MSGSESAERKVPSGSPNEAHLSETLAAVNDCLNLDENWDGEGALRIASETVSMARNLVMQVACGMGQERRWEIPSVSPDPNGHLHLLWRMENHRLLLIVDGKNPKEEIRVLV